MPYLNSPVNTYCKHKTRASHPSVGLSSHIQHRGHLYNQYSSNLHSSVPFIASLFIVCDSYFKRTVVSFDMRNILKEITSNIFTLQFKNKFKKDWRLKKAYFIVKPVTEEETERCRSSAFH